MWDKTLDFLTNITTEEKEAEVETKELSQQLVKFARKLSGSTEAKESDLKQLLQENEKLNHKLKKIIKRSEIYKLRAVSLFTLFPTSLVTKFSFLVTGIFPKLNMKFLRHQFTLAA